MKKIILGLVNDSDGHSGEDGQSPTTEITVDCFFEEVKITIPRKIVVARGDKIRIEIGED